MVVDDRLGCRYTNSRVVVIRGLGNLAKISNDTAYTAAVGSESDDAEERDGDEIEEGDAMGGDATNPEVSELIVVVNKGKGRDASVGIVVVGCLSQPQNRSFAFVMVCGRTRCKSAFVPGHRGCCTRHNSMQ